MSYSSILGAAKAPSVPAGRDSDLLGPSDNSDSGSDALGTSELHGDSDSAGTGERAASAEDNGQAEPGQDILPDRVVGLDPQEAVGADDEPAGDMTDLDAGDDILPEDDASDDELA